MGKLPAKINPTMQQSHPYVNTLGPHGALVGRTKALRLMFAGDGCQVLGDRVSQNKHGVE